MTDPVRVAAIDCGTNSVRLLVADLDPTTGVATELVRTMRIVRLGQDIDRAGRIAPEALQRCFVALDDYAATIRDLAPARIRFCATSAARDAENAAEFTAGVRERIGVDPEVIAGSAEADLSFAGATRSLPIVEEPILVVDIGGGSTELILGGSTGAPLIEESLDIGSVRLTERHLRDDPPTPEQIQALSDDVDRALDAGGVDVARAATVIGVAGTVTTIAAGVLGLAHYDRQQIHLARLPVADVHREIDQLVASTVAGRRALGYMHPDRADVIGGGALILDRLLRRTTVTDLVVSEADILDGIAWSLVIDAPPDAARGAQ